jgi:hypothetical protein
MIVPKITCIKLYLWLWYIMVVLNIDFIWNSGKSIIFCGIDNMKNGKMSIEKNTWTLVGGCLDTMKTVTWPLEEYNLKT